MKISPRTLPGALSPQNRGAADWSWQSMVAYGCRSLVVVLDPRTLQIVQTVDHQSGTVHKVKWAPQSTAHTIGDPYGLRLASADTNGRIIVWDINQAAQSAEFTDSSRAVVDMAWVGIQSGCRDLLAVIHGPSTLAVWHAERGVCIWRKSLGDPLLSLSFDPFDCSRLALRSTDCLLLINDFSPMKPPPTAAQRFFTTTSTPARSSSSASSGPVSNPSPRPDRRSKAFNRVRQLVGGSMHPRVSEGSTDVPMSDCLQIAFLKACRHHICLVYPRELLIVDLGVQQTVGYVVCERNATPFVRVMPCRQRDILYCLHESGSVSLRTRQSYLDVNRVYSTSSAAPGALPRSPTGMSGAVVGEEVTYALHCQSDTLRLSKATSVSSVQVCPMDERSVSLVLTDGRVLVWDLLSAASDARPARMPAACVATPVEVTPASHTSLGGDRETPLFPSMCLSDLLPPQWAIVNETGRIGSSSPMSTTSSSQLPPTSTGVQLQFVLTGLAQSVMLNATCLRMCPPLTSKNFSSYEALCAVGSASGVVQVFNMSTGQLARQYAAHTFPVKGIEWVSQTSFFSWAFSSPNNAGLVRNELLTIDTVTGRSRVIRATSAGEGESPLEGVRISAMRQYFTVFLKDKPMEIWDAQSLTLLRQLKERFPIATAMEWSPAKSRRPPTDKSSLTEGISSENKSAQAYIREHLVITDGDSCLRHYVIEGSNIKEGSKIPAEGSMNLISSITWKGERIVLGDIDGNLHVWDLKGKFSKSVPTHRGAVKKVRFGPGKGNQLVFVQFADSVEIWDSVTIEMMYSMKLGRESPILDIDWVTSDKPAVITAGGTLSLMDPNLRRNSSPMSSLDYEVPFFSPHAMSFKAALSLRACLQHQPWNQRYTLESLDDADENTGLLDRLMEASTVNLPSDMKEFFPKARLGTAQRCLIAARLFGDEWEVSFWEVALFYLMKCRLRQGLTAQKEAGSGGLSMASSLEPDPASPQPSATVAGAAGMSGSRPAQHVEYGFRASSANGDLNLVMVAATAARKPLPAEKMSLSVEDSHSTASVSSNTSMAGDYRVQALQNLPESIPSQLLLDMNYDLLCDTSLYQSYELKRLAVHDAKRSTYEQTKLCAMNHIFLGQTDHAVQMLLETDSTNDNYVVDSLRACLTASIRSSGASTSTIKLVATNFIANDRLDEGIRLLCLIQKGLDACRYLQTYSHWDQSAWLAKVSLSEDDHLEVIGRFADQLASPAVNNKFQSTLLHLSLENFTRVVDMLLGMQYSDMGTCFLEACAEFGVLPAGKEMAALAEKTFTEYARKLHSLGMTKAASHYCSIGGQTGRQFASWMAAQE